MRKNLKKVCGFKVLLC
uniref:Uncharacterized protein n=1 Tax=Rhizophora mucronata TaxID=61149 RepID=A0A2P2PQG5_RHIMU